MRRRSFLALASALSSGVMAQPIDLSGGGPVEITARDGIEWRREENVVIARGNAQAVRDGVTINADRLIARYRPKSGTPQQPPAQNQDPGAMGGSSEIYRVEAEGNVVIFTATDRATGDRAVYDMDQSVMVMTGRDLSLTTPDQHLTARDSLEYWSARRMAVARGEAVVTTTEDRTIRADVLVGHFRPDDAAARPSRPATGGGPATPGRETSKVDRVEAFGNVEVRTQLEVLRGDRGFYVPDEQIARVAGNVRITRGQNQLNGSLAEANLKTGVSRLLAGPGARVQGMIVQEDGSLPAPGPQPTGVPQGRRR